MLYLQVQQGFSSKGEEFQQRATDPSEWNLFKKGKESQQRSSGPSKWDQFADQETRPSRAGKVRQRASSSFLLWIVSLLLLECSPSST
jgi:hypothetical protein